TWEAALKKRAELLIKAGREAPEEAGGAITLGEWIEGYLQSREGEVRPNTLARYRTYAKHLQPLADKPLSELKVAQLEALYKDLSTRIGRSHLAHIRTFLRSALRKAVRYGYLEHSPAEIAELPKTRPEQRKARALSQGEIERLLEAARGTRYYPLLYTTLALGLRRGEVLGLRWEDVDFDRDELAVQRIIVPVAGKTTVGEPKTEGSKRILPLPPDLRDVLLDWGVELERLRLYGGWVFPAGTGAETPINPRNLERAFKGLLKKAGLPDYRFHDLRHTFATRTLASGVDPKTVSGLLGHTTVAMTLDIYTHLERERMKRAVQNVLGLSNRADGD
ncbi:tyrosine-type recombinase/integrase, partial [Oceanithermus profundus]